MIVPCLAVAFNYMDRITEIFVISTASSSHVASNAQITQTLQNRVCSSDGWMSLFRVYSGVNAGFVMILLDCKRQL